MERRLVELARDGDQAAFAQVAYEIGPRLFGAAHRIMRDFHRAEDATQQAIVEIWRSLPRLADPDRFEAWASRILVNACYSDLRRTRRVPALQVLATGPAAEDVQARVADRDMLERAFERLPVDQRAVLVLQFYLDLGYAEIADALGIPIGTVKSRISMAKSSLRAALEADARQGARWSA